MLFIDAEIMSMINSTKFLLAIITFAVMGTLFLLKIRGKTGKIRNYLIGIVLFLFLYAVSRISEFSRTLVSGDTVFRDVTWYLGAIFGAMALIPLLFVLEHIILEKKSKYIFTILSVAFFLLAIILDPSGSATSPGKIFLYLASAPALSVPFMYFYVGYKTSGDTRKRSIWAGIGFLVAFFGIIIDTALGNMIFDALLGDEIGGLATSILYMITLPLGMIIYYSSIKY